MNKVWTLAIAFLREHPTRVVLTSVSTVAATCMVVWVAAGYDSLLLAFDEWANLALGRYELSIAPISTEKPSAVPVEVLEALRRDPAVAAIDAMWMHRTTVHGKPAATTTAGRSEGTPGRERGERGGSNPRSEYVVLATRSPIPPFDVDGKWLDADRPEAMEVVVRTDTARKLNVEIDDQVMLIRDEKSIPLRVVGLINAPSLGAGGYGAKTLMTPGSGDLFLSTTSAEEIFDEPAEISFIGIAMNPAADITRFRFGWAPKLSRFSTPVQFQEAHEIEEALDESAAADNVQMQAYAATGIAMLVALLVIFSTVNMGVTERVRQFAVLRAVVLTKSQLWLLIFSEGLLLATIGFIGGLGVSWLLLTAVAQLFSKMLHHGAAIGPNSLLLGFLATYGGAVLAALIPAYRATRVRPIDAMAPQPESANGHRLPVGIILIGLLLIAVNPLLTFVSPPRFDTQVYIYLGVGFVTMAAGFVLIAPAVVAVVDRLGGPLLAYVLGIDPKLLASQITSHRWRTVATAISMAIGMGLYIGVQVWGFTMLDGFIVGPWAPDAILAFGPAGIPVDEASKMSGIEGIDARRCLPVVVEQPRLLDDLTGSAERASVTRQDNVVIVGIDPAEAFGGDRPLFDVEWVAGKPAEVIPLMQAGRACVVPDHFLTESGLKIGDGFDLVPPDKPGQPVRYTIAGAVRLPGWHWQTKLTGLRTRTHRAAALVFAKFHDVSSDFNRENATHVWFSYSSGQVDPDAISAAAKRIVSAGQATSSSRPLTTPLSVRMIPVEQIRSSTRRAASRWIWAVSLLPLITVGIGAFGVLNVILASVRSRQWEIGVLRSIGVTQLAIVRAILAEGLMIGVVASLLSLGFGIMAGWCGCGMAQYISFFGGMHPSLTVPWTTISIGLLLVLVLAVLAAVWPALSIGRLRPLTLLQRGRITF